MSPTTSTLHMMCGKAGSGKSTLAARLAGQGGTVLISEDAWLSALYAEEMTSIQDYVRCSAKLRSIMGPHVAAVLKAGVSVVLDYPANTLETRKWMQGIIASARAAHVLHVLDLPDDLCLSRLNARNARGEHPFALTEEQFRQLSRHYVAPTPNEGFTIEVHGASA